ncbi:MAG: YihY/virulence factor BrkB family protein, partial [Bdellovibrionales bacterium]|nr:YihY/virulence factor BrkB family protein [Bdellovibrionales bacterium]
MSQSYYQVGKAAVEGFIEDDCPRLAAALSFYAILSLPALLLGVLWCAGLLWDSDELRVSLTQQIEGLFGTKAASQVSTILDRGGLASGAGPAGVVSGVVLLFGASGVMLQLQAAMNKAWNVSAQTRTGLAKIIGIVIKRVFSFGMVVTISILLIISLIVSAAISLLGPKIAQIIPFIGSTTAL